MTKSLAELPFAKKLDESSFNFFFSFREIKRERDNKLIAIIFIKLYQFQFESKSSIDVRAALKCILPAQEELERFDIIKISIRSDSCGVDSSCVSEESYAYFYNFIKKTPDFNLNIYLGVGTRDGFSGPYQEFIMNRISFFREQRQVWRRLKKLSEESKAIPSGANIYALFTFTQVSSEKFDSGYCQSIIRELELKESKQVQSFNFSKCLKIKDDFNLILDLAVTAGLGQIDLCLFSFIPDTGTQHLILFSNNKVILIYDSLNDKRIVESTLLGKSINEVLAATPKTYICSVTKKAIILFSEYEKRIEEINLKLKFLDFNQKLSIVSSVPEAIKLKQIIMECIGEMVADGIVNPITYKQFFPELPLETVKNFFEERQKKLLLSLREQYTEKEEEKRQYEMEVMKSLKALSILQQPSTTPVGDLVSSVAAKK